MIWTAVEDKIITDNRGALSAAGIASLIGHDVTRNAVIGRSKRLGLERLKPIGNHKPGRPKLARIAKQPTAQREYASPPIAVIPLNIPFLKLERAHCREIVGSMGYGLSLSCGHPRIEDSSYCRWHHAINTYTRPIRFIEPLAA